MAESSSQKADVALLAMNVQIAAVGVDEDELDRMTRRLRSELEEVGVESSYCVLPISSAYLLAIALLPQVDFPSNEPVSDATRPLTSALDI